MAEKNKAVDQMSYEEALQELEEILEAVSTAIVMAGGPAVAYGSVVVLKILDELDV